MNPHETLAKAVDVHKPKYIIGLFSGGHDSLASTHITSQHPQFSFALHINTGIGIEQTREFVRQTCQEWGIELREYRADQYVQKNGKSDPQIYEEIVKQYGFPGPGQHGTMYNKLKEKPLQQAIRDLGRNTRTDKVFLVTGVRQQESLRRMRHVDPIQFWSGTRIWVAPIFSYSKLDVNQYIEDQELKRNPVVDLLHSSGECLCGAFAHEGEKEEIRQWYPDTAEMLDQLEEKVKIANKPWIWGKRPPKDYKTRLEAGMLCIGCIRE